MNRGNEEQFQQTELDFWKEKYLDLKNAVGDIEVRKRLEEEIRLDPLTRILNKKAFREETEAFLKNAGEQETAAFYVIDIDDFKEINDTFGHTVGDMVISDIAQLIREQFRSDDLVGRVGGDEFAVLMKHSEREHAQKKAQTLSKTGRKKLAGDGVELTVTLSIGVAVWKKEGTGSYATLFDQADQALYHVKRHGKGSYAFAGDFQRTGPVKVYQEEETEEQNAERFIDKEFLHLAFNLLAHARDINGSLNVLLEQIGKRYRMNMVSVFEYSEDEETIYLTNSWFDMEKIHDQKSFPVTWRELQKAEPGCFVEKNVEFENGDEWGKWFNRKVPIRSIAAVRFEFSGGRKGSIDVGSTEKDKYWNKEERDTICELGRIIAVFVTLRDKQTRDQQAIHVLKHRDKLTGLYNLETFRKKQKEIFDSRTLEDNRRYALVMIDINNFSFANENLGNENGDRILKSLAQLTNEKNEKNVAAACRMYSDYFLLLVTGETEEDILQFTRQTEERFEMHMRELYPAGRMKLSIGICFGAEDQSFDAVFESVNLARKYAKEHRIYSGVVYDEKIKQIRDEQEFIASVFHRALEQGEFQMFLQPKFCLKDSSIYGAEALARWQMADGTCIGPNRFIPVLEKLGYITELDFAIFEQLLKTMERWEKEGKQLFTISTNFSRKQFENGGEEFVKRLSDTVKRYTVDPSYIEIEVTESAVTEDQEEMKKCLEKVIQMGFQIAIDDFGTGYSSLSMLYEIPARVIKIDKSFTEKATLQGRDEFMRSMRQLIRAAKEEVVVEGIETEEQREFLKNCGFEYGQGFLFDRPIPVGEFERKYL